MSDDVEARIRWLAQFCCQPSWAAAVTCACERVEQLDPEQGAPLLQQINDTGPSVADRNNVLFDNAERMRSRDPMLTLAFEILTLCTDDDATVINAVVAGAVSVVSSTDGDTREARARLRVWDAAATGKYTGNDFFEIANISWQGEMQRNVADQEDQSRVSSGIPTCVAILAHDRWDHAMAWLRRETERQVVHQLDLEILQPRGDRNQQAAQIRAFAERLFAQGRPWTGDLAIAWLAMLCDPRRPDTFTAVLPQISWMFGHQSVITNPHERGLLRDRLGIWWRAACSEWTDSDVSIFRIAAMEMQDRDYEPEAEGDSTLDPPPVAPAATDTPTVVVMPGKLADERGLPMPWKDLRDQALQLVVCNDAAIVRERLREEFPHAWREVALLTQDLRDGQPVRMRPTLLLGHPGSGKSRLVRRLGELIAMYVYRYDGGASHDGTYAGSPKSWSSAQPSAPARAVMISRTANPIVFVDEVEKAGESTYNGNLWSAMAPFLERETAARYREVGLDAELDLSHVIHIATANSIDKLPAPLRDRYRVIRIPSPSLQHLPALAAQVLCDMAFENDERMYDAALADDELEIIGRAWVKERFSMRKLRRLVAATLEARDACAPRH